LYGSRIIRLPNEVYQEKPMKYANAIASFFLRLGLPMGPQALLTVTGRQSGLPRTTPVALNRRDGGWVLVSVYGEADWVRNLRAAGSAVVTRRRRQIPVVVQELADGDAAAVLKDLVSSMGLLLRSVIGSHFETPSTASLEEWRDEATRHPVFLLTPA
jgi:deazaflavin-dependent oxidoreductase (nitroreductase family)